MAISVVSYALIRHKFIEPFIDIECNKISEFLKDLELSAQKKDDMFLSSPFFSNTAYYSSASLAGNTLCSFAVAIQAAQNNVRRAKK